MRILGRILLITSLGLALTITIDGLYYDCLLLSPKSAIAEITAVKSSVSSIVSGKITSPVEMYRLAYSFTISGQKYRHTIIFGLVSRDKKITEFDFQRFKNSQAISVIYNHENPAINSIVSSADRNWKTGSYILNAILVVLCTGLIIIDLFASKKLVKRKTRLPMRFSLMYLTSFFMIYYFLTYIAK